MALVVEDGTGRADAESYISVASATSYHAARGNTAWALLASDTIREQLLRKATEYMLQEYRALWASFRVTVTQALDWPRAWVPIPDAPSGYGSMAAYVANNIVPVEVQRACAELALLASTTDLNPPLERTTSSEKVGPVEVTYDKTAPERKRYPQIDQMLQPYIIGGKASMGLIRA
jgi:hypothetical protein